MTKRPKPAFVTIGVSKDDAGQPLITADGRLVGTVAQVKHLIAEYECRAEASDAITREQFYAILAKNNKLLAEGIRASLRDPRNR